MEMGVLTRRDESRARNGVKPRTMLTRFNVRSPPRDYGHASCTIVQEVRVVRQVIVTPSKWVTYIHLFQVMPTVLSLIVFL